MRGDSAEGSEGVTFDLRPGADVGRFGGRGLQAEVTASAKAEEEGPGVPEGRGAGLAPGRQGARQRAGACRRGRVSGFPSQCNGKPRRFLIGAERDLITYEHNTVITNSKCTCVFITPQQLSLPELKVYKPTAHLTGPQEVTLRRLNLKYFHSIV